MPHECSQKQEHTNSQKLTKVTNIYWHNNTAHIYSLCFSFWLNAKHILDTYDYTQIKNLRRGKKSIIFQVFAAR